MGRPTSLLYELQPDPYDSATASRKLRVCLFTAVAKKIKGRSVPLENLKNITNYDLIKKVYHVKEPELNKGSISDAILSRIVTKDYVA
uniref:Uncharacterized protein n=1 Tax=Plectus sambesii TaxID=2011161 RepID=A0A914UUZ1_9BILA